MSSMLISMKIQERPSWKRNGRTKMGDVLGDQERVLGKVASYRLFELDEETAAALNTTERDICAKCGAVYPAYTYMFTCMKGCCRIGAKYQSFLGWTHICVDPNTTTGFCISLLSDENYTEAKKIFNTKPGLPPF